MENQGTDRCCRTCMIENSAFLDIYKDCICTISIAEILKSCTTLNIIKDDNLPKSICHNCYDKINNFYEFKITAEKIDSKLRADFEDNLSLKYDLEESHNNGMRNEEIDEKSYTGELSFKDESVGIGENSTSNTENFVYILIDDTNKIEESIGTNPVEKLQLIHSNICSKKYVCEICNKKFKNVSNYARHKRKCLYNSNYTSYCKVLMDDIQTTENEFCKANENKCEFCDMKLKSLKSFLKHMKLHSAKSEKISKLQNEDANFECEICKCKFPSKNLHSAHMRIHTEEKRNLSKNKCNHICNNNSTNSDNSNLYKAQIAANEFNEVKEEKCELCYAILKSSLTITTDERLHASTNNTLSCKINELGNKDNGYEKVPNVINQVDIVCDFQCEICKSKFKSKYSLSAHMRKHVEKGRVLSCGVCSKVFNKISHLKRHEYSHENNGPYKCQVCKKSFPTDALLKNHSKQHSDNKPHACPVCHKEFFHLASLNTHVKIHSRDKRYLCPTCGKRFDSSTNLNQHVKRHIGIKAFVCALCPKQFVSKGELKSHSITHTGEKLYKCERCNASFTKGSSLALHNLRHLGVKPHQCNTCPMKFTSKDHLKRHYRIHTGEKPYRCDMCERAFTQSNDLAKHRRGHLGEKIYKCTECPESFRLKSELSQHISQHYVCRRQGTDTKSNFTGTADAIFTEINDNALKE